ncbi:hypothetical protein PIB30_054830 [Stylosanthes scabra]|uniref:Uncharacterized protein n=1 Tax=Stylosanthes scabra TaxID=79078 RepID=A0ABU6QIC0_9FABA|nr:hypothetical protein [Stylosanthes scabra]
MRIEGLRVYTFSCVRRGKRRRRCNSSEGGSCGGRTSHRVYGDRTLGGGSFVNGDGGIAEENDGRTFFPFRRVSLSSKTLPSTTAMASSMNNGSEVMESDGYDSDRGRSTRRRLSLYAGFGDRGDGSPFPSPAPSQLSPFLSLFFVSLLCVC